MSEETTEPVQNNHQNQHESQPRQSPDLASELRELGQQLEQTVRTVLESDQARSVRNNLSSGILELGKQVQVALKSLQENPKVQQFAERGQKAVNQAQESQAVKDFQETLASGLAQLNEKLSAFIVRMETGPALSPNASQHVPVEDASQPAPPIVADVSEPTTGETTRLDL